MDKSGLTSNASSTNPHMAAAAGEEAGGVGKKGERLCPHRLAVPG